jgi:hypothetical protein
LDFANYSIDIIRIFEYISDKIFEKYLAGYVDHMMSKLQNKQKKETKRRAACSAVVEKEQSAVEVKEHQVLSKSKPCEGQFYAYTPKHENKTQTVFNMFTGNGG